MEENMEADSNNLEEVDARAQLGESFGGYDNTCL